MKARLYILNPDGAQAQRITEGALRSLLASGKIDAQTPCARASDGKRMRVAEALADAAGTPACDAAARRRPTDAERSYLIANGLVEVRFVDSLSHAQAAALIKRHRRGVALKRAAWALVATACVCAGIPFLLNAKKSAAPAPAQKTAAATPQVSEALPWEVGEVTQAPVADVPPEAVSRGAVAEDETPQKPSADTAEDLDKNPPAASPAPDDTPTRVADTPTPARAESEAVGSAAASAAPAFDKAQPRVWRNREGQGVEGRFVDCENGLLTIVRLADEREFSFPLSLLHDDDIKLLKDNGLFKEGDIDESVRVWTNWQGVGVKAKVVGFDKTKLRIQRLSDGATFQIYIDWLCDDDRTFLKGYMARAKEKLEKEQGLKLDIPPFRLGKSYASRRFIDDVDTAIRAAGINENDALPKETFLLCSLPAKDLRTGEPCAAEIMFLEPLKDVLNKLNIRRTGWGHEVDTIGWGRNSFFYYAYPLDYDSPIRPGYYEIFFVTDRAQRVVAIQLNGHSKSPSATHQGLPMKNMIRMIGFKSRFAAHTHACFSSSPITGEYVTTLESAFFKHASRDQPRACPDGDEAIFGFKLYLPRCVGAIVLRNLAAIRESDTSAFKDRASLEDITRRKGIRGGVR